MRGCRSQGRHRVIRDLRQRRHLACGQTPQYGVDEAHVTGRELPPPRQMGSLVHRSVGRYFIQEKYLVGPQPQDVPHQGVHLAPGQAGKPRQQVIQAQLPALHPLDQFQHEGALVFREVRVLFQDVGEEVLHVPVLGLGCGEDVQGQFPGRGLGGGGFCDNVALRKK